MNYSLNNTHVLNALNLADERGAMQLVVCKRPDGVVETKGNWDKREVVKALESMISEEDALSLHWVPKGEFPKLKMPLQDLLKKPNEVKGMVTKIMNLVLKESNAKYGVGKFDMWSYPIEKAFMVQTASLVKDLPDTFRLRDILDWFEMKGFNISNGPPASCLKIASGVKNWLVVVKILLEFLLVVKGVDPAQWVISASSAQSLPVTLAPNTSVAPSTSGARLLSVTNIVLSISILFLQAW